MLSKILVDPEDRWLLDLWDWKPRKPGKSSTHYAVADTTFEMRRFGLRLHHFIVGHPLPGYHVDHINRNGLDNRRRNLRVVTVSNSMINRRGWSTLGHRHVYPHNQTRWKVVINRGGQPIRSYHDTLDEALTSRDKFLSKLETGDAK